VTRIVAEEQVARRAARAAAVDAMRVDDEAATAA
jgi:hypothetical protein